MVAGAEEPEQAGQRVEREDVAAAQRAPDVASSSAVSTVCGREAMNAPLSAPGGRADDQVRVDVALVEARSIPTWIAPRLAPPERTNATFGFLDLRAMTR